MCSVDFAVEYSAEALLQLESLDKTVAKRIIKKIDNARNNPRHFFKGLTGRPECKLRVGDYRAIANLDESKRTIFIRTMGHRKNIYKN